MCWINFEYSLHSVELNLGNVDVSDMSIFEH